MARLARIAIPDVPHHVTQRRNLYADARGSIVLSTTSPGATPQINTYDEYGIPGSANTGRFQYTGQVWLPELGMNYYKARLYSPLLGRFMQTDPSGYEDNVNLYGYVANDPVNNVDPGGERALAVGRIVWRIATGSRGNAFSRAWRELKVDWNAINAGSTTF